MTGSGFRSAWGVPAAPPAPEPEASAPLPPPKAVRAPTRRVERRDESLARQVAQGLIDECDARGLTLPQFAALTGVGLSSIRAHRYGQGLRVDTLEKYAQALGWSIVITDINSTEIGRV